MGSFSMHLFWISKLSAFSNEFSQFFEVNYVKQIDEGYQLSRVRNLGIRSARHDYIIILDCDMAPVPSLVEDQMKWMTLNRKVITLGHRRYVDANLDSYSGF